MIQTRTTSSRRRPRGGNVKVSANSYAVIVHEFAPCLSFSGDWGRWRNVEEEPEVGSLKVKLPSFWPDKPEAWFVQAESNFKARRISSQQSKFHLVVIALDSETVDGVLDLLEAPPEDDPYDQLRTRLVQSFKLSKVDKIKRAMESTWRAMTRTRSSWRTRLWP